MFAQEAITYSSIAAITWIVFENIWLTYMSHKKIIYTFNTGFLTQNGIVQLDHSPLEGICISVIFIISRNQIYPHMTKNVIPTFAKCTRKIKEMILFWLL